MKLVAILRDALGQMHLFQMWFCCCTSKEFAQENSGHSSLKARCTAVLPEYAVLDLTVFLNRKNNNIAYCTIRINASLLDVGKIKEATPKTSLEIKVQDD